MARHKKMPVDLIAGTARFRTLVEAKASLKDFLNDAKEDSAALAKEPKPYLLYPRK